MLFDCLSLISLYNSKWFSEEIRGNHCTESPSVAAPWDGLGPGGAAGSLCLRKLGQKHWDLLPRVLSSLRFISPRVTLFIFQMRKKLLGLAPKSDSPSVMPLPIKHTNWKAACWMSLFLQQDKRWTCADSPLFYTRYFHLQFHFILKTTQTRT